MEDNIQGIIDLTKSDYVGWKTIATYMRLRGIDYVSYTNYVRHFEISLSFKDPSLYISDFRYKLTLFENSMFSGESEFSVMGMCVYEFCKDCGGECGNGCILFINCYDNNSFQVVGYSDTRMLGEEYYKLFNNKLTKDIVKRKE